MCGVVDGGIVAGLLGLRGRPVRRRRHLRLVRRRPVPGRRTPRPPRRAGIDAARAPHRARRRSRRSASTASSRSTGTPATARCSSTTSSPASSSGRPWPTRPEDIYRALLEATAFGTRTIVEAFDGRGRPGHRARRRGRPAQEPLPHADLRRRHPRCRCRRSPSTQGPALGSAIHAAVAAGAYPDVRAAARRWAGAIARRLHPRRGRGRCATTRLRRVPTLCTTTSAAAATTSCTGSRRSAARRTPAAASTAGRRADAGRRHAAAVPAELPASVQRRPSRAARERVAAPARRAAALRPGRLDRRQRLASACAAATPTCSSSSRPASPTTSSTAGVMVVCDLDGDMIDDGDRAPVQSDTAAHAYVYRAHARGRRRRAHPLDLRRPPGRRAAEPMPCVLTRWPTSSAARSRSAVRADRRRLDRPRHRRDAARLAHAGGAHAQPRPVHDRQGRQGRGQGRRDVRGRRPHRPPRPRSSASRCRSTQADIDSLYDRYQNVYGQRCNPRSSIAVNNPFEGRADLVPHRQPGPVRRGDAAPGRRAVAADRRRARRRRRHPGRRSSGSRCSRTPTSIRRARARRQRRRRLHRRHRLDAHLLARPRCGSAASTRCASRCCTCTRRPTSSCRGRTSTWTS